MQGNWNANLYTMEGTSVIQPVGSWHKRVKIKEICWKLFAWSGRDDAAVLQYNNRLFEHLTDITVSTKKKHELVRKFFKQLEAEEPMFTNHLNSELQHAIAELDFTIEEFQAGKHRKGLGAVALFKQDSAANQRIQ